MKTPPSSAFLALPPFDEEDNALLNAVIEAPKGSRNKFDFDPDLGVFYLGGVLPAGAVFPFDFGFVPGTLGEDGDPLDVVVLTDEGSHAFAGCLVKTRLLGAIKAEQGENDGKLSRNDRLIGVAAESHTLGEARTFEDLPAQIVQDIEHFFRSYNASKGVEFRSLGICGPAEARELVQAGIERRK